MVVAALHTHPLHGRSFTSHNTGANNYGPVNFISEFNAVINSRKSCVKAHEIATNTPIEQAQRVNGKFLRDSNIFGVKFYLSLWSLSLPLENTGQFFNCSHPKNSMCQPVSNFWHLELFWWDLLCSEMWWEQLKNHPVPLWLPLPVSKCSAGSGKCFSCIILRLMWKFSNFWGSTQLVWPANFSLTCSTP